MTIEDYNAASSTYDNGYLSCPEGDKSKDYIRQEKSKFQRQAYHLDLHAVTSEQEQQLSDKCDDSDDETYVEKTSKFRSPPKESARGVIDLEEKQLKEKKSLKSPRKWFGLKRSSTGKSPRLSTHSPDSSTSNITSTDSDSELDKSRVVSPRKVCFINKEQTAKLMKLKSRQISVETFANEVLSKGYFDDLPLIKSSDEKKHNNAIISGIKKNIADDPSNQFTCQGVDEIVSNIVYRKIDSICSVILGYRKQYYHISPDDIHSTCIQVVHNVASTINQKQVLYEYLHSNLALLKFYYGRSIKTLSDQKKSDWMIKLYDVINEALNIKYVDSEISGGTSQSSKIDSLLRLIDREVKDENIRTLMLQVFNSDKIVARDVLRRFKYWSNPLAITDMLPIAKERFNLNQTHRRVVTSSAEFQDETIEFLEKFANCDLGQVARSYIMHNLPNLNSLTVNGTPYTVSFDGSRKSCYQKEYFSGLLRMLIQKGLKPSSKIEKLDKWIDREVGKLLQLESCFAGDILFIGSNSAWRICDTRLRAMYPGIFSMPLSTRMDQGTDMAVNIVNQEKYNVCSVRAYTIYPLLNPEDPDSFAIDNTRPLARLTVSWTVDFLSARGISTYSYNIATPSVDRLEATEVEWKKVINILSMPLPIKGITLPMPKSTRLTHAINQVL